MVSAMKKRQVVLELKTGEFDFVMEVFFKKVEGLCQNMVDGKGVN